MPDVNVVRKNILEEDVKSKRSLSAAIGFKLAASLNFINKRQYDRHSWHMNGRYSEAQLAIVGDGIFVCQEDMEIIGYSLYSGYAGGAANTIVDLRLISSDGSDSGSLFSTKPEVNHQATSKSFSHSNIRSDNHDIPAHHTKGIFSTINLNRHDGILLVLDQAMTGGQDLQFTLFFRPR